MQRLGPRGIGPTQSSVAAGFGAKTIETGLVLIG
jgi:hypothetical protein